MVLRRDGAAVDPKARRASRFRGRRTHQPGLPEARLAGQEERMPVTLRRVGDQPIGEREEIVAPHEDRA